MSFEPLTPERRRQQTREYLLEAAARVFAERGFNGASLDEVAATAGFTKGAVYSNFKNKDDLFMALLESEYERAMRALHDTLDATSDDPPEDHIGEFIKLVQEQFDTDDDYWAALYQEFCAYAVRSPSARTRLAEFEQADIESIARIIEDGRKRNGIEGAEPPEHAARFVEALIRGLHNMRLIDPDAVDRSMIESAMLMMVRALVTDPGMSVKRPD